MSECEQRKIVASYGPGESVDTFPRWITSEQVSAFPTLQIRGNSTWLDLSPLL